MLGVPYLWPDSNLRCRCFKCPKWRRGSATRGRNTEQGCRRPCSSSCLPLARLVTLQMVISLLRSFIKRGRDLSHRPHIAQSDEGCENTLQTTQIWESISRNPSICKLWWKEGPCHSYLRNGMAPWMGYDLWLEAKSTLKMVPCRLQRRTSELFVPVTVSCKQ